MSKIIESVRSDLQGLANIGVVKKETMREFNRKHPQNRQQLAPRPVDMTATDIHRLRVSLNVSQAVLATHLNINVSTVRKWEHGDTKPSGTSLKLLSVIKKKGLEAVS